MTGGPDERPATVGRDPSGRCPCGSGDVLRDCCAPILDGAPAPTALALMRSRYTAFAVGAREHLLTSWDPSTRPTDLTLDDGPRWLRLDIIATVAGGPFDTDGTVEFEAFYRDADGRQSLHERSRFIKDAGRWYYVDGDLLPGTGMP